MGLDNGFIVTSNKRKITRDMLPSCLDYPFDSKYDDDKGPEIIYWRKNWGLRNQIVHLCRTNDDFYYIIDDVKQVEDIIKIITYFLDEKIWDNEGQSIWTYDEIKATLKNNIADLTVIKNFMVDNPDVFLLFYDSY